MDVYERRSIASSSLYGTLLIHLKNVLSTVFDMDGVFSSVFLHRV